MKQQRKKRDTSKKREDILNGAIEAFRKYGYETVNMDQIALTAGASKRTVYNHFSSKEELLLAVIARYLDAYQEIKEQIIYKPDIDLKNQIYEFIDAEIYLINSPERLTLAKVLTSVFLWNTELAVKTHSRYSHKEDPLVLWLKSAEKEKRVSVTKPEKTAELFISLIQGAITWPLLFRPEGDIDFINERRNTIAEMFLREIKSKGYICKE